MPPGRLSTPSVDDGRESANPMTHETQRIDSVRCAILTVSDTRTAENDASGRALRAFLAEAGHTITAYEIVPDQANRIRETVQGWGGRDLATAILVTGGTGVAPRDMTPEALEPIFDKPLTGFGELFRRLSFDEIGPAAMLSRATAGTIGRSIIYILPGSTAAVRLAVTRLILPTLPHAAWLLLK